VAAGCGAGRATAAGDGAGGTARGGGGAGRAATGGATGRAAVGSGPRLAAGGEEVCTAGRDGILGFTAGGAVGNFLALGWLGFAGCTVGLAG
jgi:hypothetical protein